MPPRIVARYPYVDEQRKLLFEVERLNPKGFRQRRPDGDEWIYNLEGTRRVPYRLPELIAAVAAGEWVAIVEGEKDADTLVTAGKQATTFPGGAGKFRRRGYEDFFRGAKLWIVADIDADNKGLKHAVEVAQALNDVAAKIVVYQPAGGAKDVTDHLEKGYALRDLVQTDWSAEVVQPSDHGYGPNLRVMFADEVMALPAPSLERALLGPAIVMGNRLLTLAETGGGKTTLNFQMIAATVFGQDFLDWKGRGDCRALIIDLEQGAYSVKRCYAESGLADAGNKVGLIHEPSGIALDEDKGTQRFFESVFEQEHWDLVLLDPIANCVTGSLNDEQAIRRLARLFDSWRHRFGFAMLLPTQVRKRLPGTTFSMDDAFGSKVMTWGAEAVLGLQRKGDGAADLFWFKDREGGLPPINSRWPLLFNKDTHTFFRDPRTGREPKSDTRVRAVLEAEPDLTTGEIYIRLGGREGTGLSKGTIEGALERVHAHHDGAHARSNRRWRLPEVIDGFDAAFEPDEESAA